tara:strand:+ start:8883 stop:9077 length:195 start_codon:yes stop_codon:yes gene_type:complete
MTPTEALILSREFPKNRTVPKRIFESMEKARGDNRKKFEQIVEGLFIDCKADEDFILLNKYFGE